MTDSNTLQFNVTGINCHCESNVVIAPYTPAYIFNIEAVAAFFTEYTPTGVHTILFHPSISFGLRGPPSFA